jgi:predicted nucleic acid-binding protein
VLGKEFPVAERKQVISLLCSICNIVSISSENITKAIDSGITDDLEDALQIQCAVESDCDYFVTRDLELFKGSPIPAVLPHDLVEKLAL